MANHEVKIKVIDQRAYYVGGAEVKLECVTTEELVGIKITPTEGADVGKVSFTVPHENAYSEYVYRITVTYGDNSISRDFLLSKAVTYDEFVIKVKRFDVIYPDEYTILIPDEINITAVNGGWKKSINVWRKTGSISYTFTSDSTTYKIKVSGSITYSGSPFRPYNIILYKSKVEFFEILPDHTRGVAYIPYEDAMQSLNASFIKRTIADFLIPPSLPTNAFYDEDIISNFTVANIGERDGIIYLKIYANDELIYNEENVLNAGETQAKAIQLSFPEPGIYDIKIVTFGENELEP